MPPPHTAVVLSLLAVIAVGAAIEIGIIAMAAVMHEIGTLGIRVETGTGNWAETGIVTTINENGIGAGTEAKTKTTTTDAGRSVDEEVQNTLIIEGPHLWQKFKSRGGRKRICIPIGGATWTGIDHPMWVGFLVLEEVLILWKGMYVMGFIKKDFTDSRIS
jgi:hypothetical protein